MDIFIERVTTGDDRDAMLEVWAQVFEREMGITLAPGEVADNGRGAHLLARLGPGGPAVGTLSVVDTSDDLRLRESYNLGFDAGTLSARFMHLAVLRPFRGMNIPLMMALEAHRHVIAPGRYDYTWLLFDAERAPMSFLSRRLGFTPKADVFVSEYGSRCPLVRDERAEESARAVRRAEDFISRSRAPVSPTALSAAPGALAL